MGFLGWCFCFSLCVVGLFISGFCWCFGLWWCFFVKFLEVVWGCGGFLFAFFVALLGFFVWFSCLEGVLGWLGGCIGYVGLLRLYCVFGGWVCCVEEVGLLLVLGLVYYVGVVFGVV